MAIVVKATAALIFNGSYHKGCRHFLNESTICLIIELNLYPQLSLNETFSAHKIFLSMPLRCFSRFHSPLLTLPPPSTKSEHLSDSSKEARGNWTLMNGHPLPGFPKDEHHFFEITTETRQKNAYFPATGSRDFGNN